MNQPVEDSFESSLRNYFAAPAPESQFVDLLEVNLAAEASLMQTSRRRSWKPRVVLAFAALILALVSTIGIIGPERVWAAVRGLLGYVPGIGIVPVSADAMVLVEPIEYTHDGVTLRVEQLLANSDNTLLTYRLSGMPTDEIVHRAYLEITPGQNLYSKEGSFDSVCRGPDCPPIWNYRGIQKFYELPKGTNQLTLVWKRYSPNQLDVTQEWRIPIQLKPLTDELRARFFPPAYSPPGAVASTQDVTVKIRDVTQDISTSVVNTYLVWPDKFDRVDFTDQVFLTNEQGDRFFQQEVPVMFNDQGQVLHSTPVGPGMPALTGEDRTLIFQPIEPASKQLTFHAQELYWRAYFYANLPIDLGPNPTFGKEWPLDVTLEVAGEKLHLTGMRLVEMDWTQVEKVPLLEFRADPIPEDSGLRIDILYFDGGDNKAPGYTVGQGPADGFIPGVVLSPEQLKTGKLTLFGHDAYGILRGPWQVTWDIPKH